MTTIDGKKLSISLKESLRDKVNVLEHQFGRKPCLAVIIVGDNPASWSYIKGKIKASEFVGIDSRLVSLPETVSEKELLQNIALLNKDDSVDAILLQLPIPGHIDKDKVINSISIEKDVDGFHALNVANLWLGLQCMSPCTPKGILYMLHESGVEIEGKRAVVVGRSNIVGKPVAKLLMDEGATVTIAHSKTTNLSEVTKTADILVVATGHAHLIDGTMIKKGATVIDVGISRSADGTLCGDVDFDSASQVASAVSPVPGGVGPMTIAMLMSNTVDCFINRHKF